MKKNILGLSLCAVALSGLLFVSCTEEETKEVVADVPTLTVTSSVTVSATGGQYNFSYSVTNAADDGVVTAAGNASWISDITVASGSISFNISENTSASVRTGQITVTYSYTEDGSAKSVYEYVGVVQNGATAPVLSVQPNAVTADYAGGTYSFDYNVTDAVEDGEIACTVDADWVSNFDYSNYGTVSFDVEANEDETLRTATITVTYTYSGNKLEKEVTVIQDHPGSGDDNNGGGGGDVSDVIGTYTAHGTVYGNGITVRTSMDWTVKIYAYTGSLSGYNIYVDGLIPWAEGAYDALHAHTYSAYATYDATTGTISIPSQTTGATISSTSGSTYYFGYTPCVAASDSGYSYNKNYPDLVFTLSGSKWSAEYGVFMAGCTENDITTFTSYFQVVCPATIETFTLTRTSSTTDITDSSKIAHPITEGLQLYNDVVVM